VTTAATAVSDDASNDDLDVDEIDSDGAVGDPGTEKIWTAMHRRRMSS